MENETQNKEAEQAESNQEAVKETNPMAEAKEILSQIKEQNRIMNDNLKVAQEMKATEMLSGSASAGSETKQRSKEEKAIEEAKKLIAGSGFEEELFPEK